ncbi:MAG: hypothetical protein FJ010_01300 [Chloroflexi bacterium]|nr:hypothetical protein [Chloroflexota bacterium]
MSRDQQYSHEIEQLLGFSWGIITIGVMILLGTMWYYARFTPVNVGGVFYVVTATFVSIFIGAIVVLFDQEHWLTRTAAFLYRSPRTNAVLILVLVVLIGGLYVSREFFLAQRYPFFELESFDFGLSWVLSGFFLGVGGNSLFRVTTKLKQSIVGRHIHYLAYLDNHVVAIGALIGLVLFFYRNSYEGALLKLDDLYFISYVRSSSPWAGFINPPDAYASFYRPLHFLTIWLHYHLVGLDYAKYQLVLIVGHLVVLTLLYFFLYSINHNRIISFVLTLVFSVHIYVSLLVIFVTTVVWWFGVIAGAVNFYISKPKLKLLPHLLLGFLLMMSLLMAESGFTLVFAVCFFALYAFFIKEINLRNVLSLVMVNVGVVAIYFFLRWKAVGFLPGDLSASSGYFGDFYEDPQQLGMKFYLYTLTANFMATFIPIFTQGGEIIKNSVLLILAGAILFSLYVILLRKFSANFVVQILLFILFYVLLIKSRILIRRFLGYGYQYDLSFALHTILGFSLVLLFSRWKKVSKQHKLIMFYAIGLIVGASIVSFAYFRWRTHYLSLMGWVIIIAVGLQYLHTLKSGRAVLVSLLILASILIWEQAALLDARFPEITIRQYQHCLCHPSVDQDVFDEVVEFYGIDVESLLSECEEGDWGIYHDC